MNLQIFWDKHKQLKVHTTLGNQIIVKQKSHEFIQCYHGYSQENINSTKLRHVQICSIVLNNSKEKNNLIFVAKIFLFSKAK